MDEASFRNRLEADGYSEVLVRTVDKGYALDTHEHAWDSRLLVLSGEMTIGSESGSTTYRAGDICDLARNRPHTESYTTGAQILIGRRR